MKTDFTDWKHEFYKKKPWIKVRNQIRDRDKMRCQKCGKLIYGKSIVDHIRPITENNCTDTNILYGHDNLELLCIKCHNRKTFIKSTNYDLKNRQEPSRW